MLVCDNALLPPYQLARPTTNTPTTHTVEFLQKKQRLFYLAYTFEVLRLIEEGEGIMAYAHT